MVDVFIGTESLRRLPHLPYWLAGCVLGLLAMAGCSSLPTIVADLARRPGPPVQLEGARGPLSAAQSKAILDRLEGRSSVGTLGTPAAFFQQLADNGVEVLEFNPINPRRHGRNGS